MTKKMMILAMKIIVMALLLRHLHRIMIRLLASPLRASVTVVAYLGDTVAGLGTTDAAGTFAM